jgi:formylglycine-generating enzyme required for sulfatase activity
MSQRFTVVAVFGAFLLALASLLPAQAAVTGVTLSSTPPSPVRIGTPVTLRAVATSAGAVAYKFRVGIKSGTSYGWTTLREYSTTATCPWTPAAAATYSLVVYARTVGSTAAYEAFTTLAFTVKEPLAGVGLSASPRTPQTVGTPVTLTASPVGGGQVEYKFRVGIKSGGVYQWTELRPYQTDRVCVWTPAAPGAYTLAVYAREVGSTKSYDVYKTLAYAIYPVPPTAVALSANPSPTWVGRETTLRATPTGGTQVHYRFRVARKIGAVLTWTTVQEMSASATCAWTPTVAATYTVAVYAKEVGSPKSYDCYKAISLTVPATPPIPTLTGFTPATGPKGTLVTLTGTNLFGATGVACNGVPAPFTVMSATRVTATVPAGAMSGPFTVTTPGGTATSATSFTYIATPPTLTDFTPTHGPMGTSVTLTGTGFTGTTSVTFNTSPATFTVVSDTTLTAVVPAEAPRGRGVITVTTPDGQVSSATEFAVEDETAPSEAEIQAAMDGPGAAITAAYQVALATATPAAAAEAMVTLAQRTPGIAATGLLAGGDGIWVRYDCGLRHLISTPERETSTSIAKAAMTVANPVRARSLVGKFGAAIYAPFGDPDLPKLVEVAQRQYGADHVIFDWQVTVQDLASIPPTGLIYFTTHGSSTLADVPDSYTYFITNERYTEQLHAQYNATYHLDARDLIPGTLLENGQENRYFGVTPSFFTKTLPALPDSLVFVDSCLSLFRDDMAQAFLDKGAQAYVGWTYITKTWLGDAARKSLLGQMLGYTDLGSTRCEVKRLKDAFDSGPNNAEMPDYLRYLSGWRYVRADGYLVQLQYRGKDATGTPYGSWWSPATQQVTLDGFWLDKYEVTVAQYRTFCAATGRALPHFPQPIIDWGLSSNLSWAGKSGWDDPSLQQHPIVNVTWYDAKAYADWAGLRLPTEAQWEYAARGSAGRNYPWGGVATEANPYGGSNSSNCANYYNSYAVNKSTWPVGSFPSGVSWCGAHDLAGNVWEWCADWYGNYSSTPVTNPTGPASGSYRVLRGGSWYVSEIITRGAGRNDGGSPDGDWYGSGFRCVSLSPGP